MQANLAAQRLIAMLAGLSALTFLVVNGDLVEYWMSDRHVNMPLLRLHIRTHGPYQMPDLLGTIRVPLLQSLLLYNVAPSDRRSFTDSISGSSNYPHLR